MNKNELYVQYGCGLSAPKGWQNFDASPSIFLNKIPFIKKLFPSKIPPFPPNVKYGDIVKGLPLPPESTRLVYASHILEHLALEDFRKALNNTYKILKNEGVFRLVVPDLEWCISQYSLNPSETRSYVFMQHANLGIIQRDRGIFGFLRKLLGNSTHLWMWDFSSMKKELEDIGFVNIRRVSFNDSKHYEFKAVEDEGRFINALAIECQKPL